ncbi:dioxygenase family protein [Sphingobacterium sp. MYb382]|uniref:dioxygenase family protein n=1 Tax=Sphingobacterium sp. MYb382 TaxID=2745278 RepID=UPI00309BA64E
MDFKIRVIPLLLLTIISSLTSCKAQSKKKVGGACDGCEAIYEYESKILYSVDTLPEFQQNEPKLKISGTVFKMDGITPAENVIIYIYHTNRQGIYETKGNETGWAKRHGFIRGWVKTGKDGLYTFYTFRPAPYPDGSECEHIHITIKESDKNEYYLDEYLFDDDPLLTPSIKNTLKNRGGSGIVSPQAENKILTINRNIILGKNIPNYE